MAKKNENIQLDINSITETIRQATLSCYGINLIEENLTKGSKEEGITITLNADQTISTEIYVSLADDVKFTEILRSTQKTIRYALDKKFPSLVKQVNIYAVKHNG